MVLHLPVPVSFIKLNTKIHVKNDKVIGLGYVDLGYKMIPQC